MCDAGGKGTRRERDQRARTLFPHRHACGPEDRERALEVRRDDGIPLVLCHVEEHALAQGPCQADDAVDATEVVDRILDDRCAPSHLRDACSVGDYLPSCGADLFDDLLGDLACRLGAVDCHAIVVHHDPGSLGRAGNSDGTPDPASCSGDSYRLAVEIAHDSPPIIVLVTAESTRQSDAASDWLLG